MKSRNRLLAFFIFLSCPALVRAEPVCVKADKATLRTGPGTKYPVSWVVGQYMPLNKVDQKGSWIQVEDLDGAKHWVARSTVSNRINCVVVKSRSAPLRQGPGTKYPSSEPSFADRYTPFKKLNRDGAWIELQDEFRGKFWVYETNVWFPVMRTRISF